MSHRTTIVFSDALWRDILGCKGDENATDYIRVAVLARIYFEQGREEGMSQALEKATKNLR